MLNVKGALAINACTIYSEENLKNVDAAWKCCFEFSDPVIPTLSPPQNQESDQLLNPNNAITMIDGSPITSDCTGNIFYYQTPTGDYTTMYRDSAGTVHEIDIFYTAGSSLRTKSAINDELQTILSEKNAMLLMNCNGINSCLRFNFASKCKQKV